jgi:hypothetical protein
MLYGDQANAMLRAAHEDQPVRVAVPVCVNCLENLKRRARGEGEDGPDVSPGGATSILDGIYAYDLLPYASGARAPSISIFGAVFGGAAAFFALRYLSKSDLMGFPVPAPVGKRG